MHEQVAGVNSQARPPESLPARARRHADAFVQLVHLLNVAAAGAPTRAATQNPNPEPTAGPARPGRRCAAALCGDVLATLTALVAGNAASRARVAHDIGYDQILTVVLRQARIPNSVGRAPEPRREPGLVSQAHCLRSGCYLWLVAQLTSFATARSAAEQAGHSRTCRQHTLSPFPCKALTGRAFKRARTRPPGAAGRPR